MSYPAKHHCLPGLAVTHFLQSLEILFLGSYSYFSLLLFGLMGFSTENIRELLRGDASFELPTEFCWSYPVLGIKDSEEAVCCLSRHDY